jgi:hypothetical protein
MEMAAAVLVQTIVSGDERLKTLLREQATKSPTAAAEFLVPYYVAMLNAIKRTQQ